MRQLLRPLLVSITLVLVSSAMAQDLLITPKWKRDDLRTLYITEKRTMPGMNEEGEVVEMVHEHNTSSKVKVYDITPEAIMISIDHENIVLPVVRPYFGTVLPGELDAYRRMIIRYKVDRQTGAAVLMNPSDLLEFARGAANISTRMLRKKDAAAAGQLEQEIAPLIEQFNEPYRIEEYFGQYYSFLTDAFGKPLTQGQPLEEVEMEPDPFGAAGDSLAVVTKVFLEHQNSDQATVKMVQGLATGSQTVAGKGSQKARTANDAVSVSEFHQEMNFTLDLKTTWPVRMDLVNQVTFTNGMVFSGSLNIEVR